VLYRVWCSYHNYVKKTIKVKILWHHNAPFSSSSSHSSYFFRGTRPSFNTLTCCLRLFRMLGFDWYCTNVAFPIGWSPYSYWCNGTCRDWYLSLLGCTIGYLCDVTWGHLITFLTFQKSSGAILSSNAIFLYGPITWARIYFDSNKCSFGCCANIFSLLCRSNSRGLVISSSYHPFILFILRPFPYNTLYSFRYTISYNFAYFMMLLWSYHWWFGYPFAMLPVQEWVHCNPWYVSRYCWNYRIKKWNSCTQRWMDIVIIRNNFCTLADIIIANPSHIDLVQHVSTMIMHVATIIVQNNAQSYITNLPPLCMSVFLTP